jgi:microsomal dipeptidase-like Zn-dependent dipeptidase
MNRHIRSFVSLSLLALAACGGSLPPVIAPPVPTPGPIPAPPPGPRGTTIDWSFEAGLEGWRQERGAQPICAAVMADRLTLATRHALAKPGDYWRTPIDVGQEGTCRVDTGALPRQATVLTSPEFTITQRYVALFVGGGGRAGTKVQLELKRDGFAAARVERGDGALQMHGVTWDVGDVKGEIARISIADDGAADGGILVDHIYDTDAPPAARPSPLWGFADTHAHPVSQWAFGRHIVVGQNDGPLEKALEACDVEHGRDGMGGAAGPLIAFLEPSFNRVVGHRTGGFPELDGWPRFASEAHQQMYVDWIRRAWQGGLRLLVAHAVNNEQLAAGFNGISPYEDMSVVQVQLDQMRAFVSRHTDFMEVAYSSADARRIIGAGRLAIILGVEVDAIGGCRRDGDCNEAAARRAIGQLHAWGARHVFPIHLADNAFGGAAIYNNGLFDLLTWYLRGTYQEVAHDDSVAFALALRDQALPVWFSELSRSKNRYGASPYDPPLATYRRVPAGHVNAVGLTSLGAAGLDELRRRGIIVDVDHMGERARQQTIAMFEASRTPLAMGHAWFRDLGYAANESEDSLKLRNEAMKGASEIEAVRRMGGIVSPITNQGDVRRVLPGSECEGASTSWMQAYAYAVERMGSIGVGLGTDMNGLAQEPLPRFGPYACIARTRANGDDHARQVPGLTMRQTLRRDADAQEGGVTYDRPIVTARAHRFFGPVDLDDAPYDAVERSVWIGIAACKAKKLGPPDSDLTTERDVVEPVAAGFCGAAQAGSFTWWKAAALVATGAPRPTGSDALARRYDTVARIALQWSKMESGNAGAPLERYVVASARDFDVNLDGLAHYGLLPDFLQDVSNQLRARGGAVSDLRSAFQSAEAYVRMWERVEASASDTRSDMKSDMKMEGK